MNEYKIADKYLIVPKVKELNEYLYKFHTENFHCNEKDLVEIFKEKGIGYYGLTKVIQEYISQCPACVMTIKNIKRIDPVKAISINGPNFRYEYGITYLNEDLAEAYGVECILSI